MYLAAFEKCLQNQKIEAFRTAFRIEQVRGLLTADTHSLLKSRGSVKRLVISPAVLDIDLEMFGLSPATRITCYGYKSRDIAELDSLLGERWDILCKPEGCRYITNIRLRLKKDLTNLASISAATCRLDIPEKGSYREVLWQDMNPVDDDK